MKRAPIWKNIKFWYINAAVVILLGPLLLLFVFTEVIDPFWSGFAVDSDGYVYVGHASCIGVYEDGALVKKIQLPPYRSYRFTLLQDDRILLSNGHDVETLDMEGNRLTAREDEGSRTYTELERLRVFTAADGTQYRMRGYWGWTRVIGEEDGQVVYRMPFLEYLAKIMIYFTIIDLATAVLSILYLGSPEIRYAVNELRRWITKGDG